MFFPTPKSTIASCSFAKSEVFSVAIEQLLEARRSDTENDSCPEIRYCTAYFVRETARSESNISQ